MARLLTIERLLALAALLAVAVPFAAPAVETNAQHFSIPNTIGVHTVTSDREYLPLVVCYGETSVSTNLPLNRTQHATNLVFTANLEEDDRLFVYDHGRKGYVTYVLDANKCWQPDVVFAATETAQKEKKDFSPAGDQSQAWGYGFWLYRKDADKRADKSVWLAGQVPVGEVRITLAPTTSEVKGGKTVYTYGETLVGNPLGEPWDLNDKSVMDWASAGVVENDHIQLNDEKATVFYWQKDRLTGVASWSTKTIDRVPAVIPPGASFWFVRGKKGNAPMTVTFRTGL